MEKEDKKKILGLLFQEKILVSPDFVISLDNYPYSEHLLEAIKSRISLSSIKVADTGLLGEAASSISAAASCTVGEANLQQQQAQEKRGEVKVVSTYNEESKKRCMNDFVHYFNHRFKALRNILMYRQELKNTVSIKMILQKKERETLSLIGMVNSKETTANGNIMLSVEDPTGMIKVLINKKNKEEFEKAKNIVLDEVLGVSGVSGDRIVFANSIVFPEIPTSNEFKKSPEEGYALFLSDIHVGSKMFMRDKFEQLLRWLRGETGSEEQKAVASSIKYIIITGDLVDGVGIYPNQDEELYAKDIFEQYSECACLLSKIPSSINIIISPGNHDALRIAEPQPALISEFTSALSKLPNAILVSNPAVVNIDSSSRFGGFNLLLYHGYSFDYYVANVESIRNNGKYHNIDGLMEFLLQKRHLSPTHGFNPYIPDANRDPLVIEKVPDFFVTGHVHSSPKVKNYRGVTLISGGCWQSITPFQEKVGHTPDPAKVPLVNLKTREVKVLKF